MSTMDGKSEFDGIFDLRSTFGPLKC